MKQGSHIMLQRLVKSTVRTEPRPGRTVLEPWRGRSSSWCSGMSRPGKFPSILAVDGALFHHPDLAIALDDLRLTFADLLVNEVGPILLAVEDPIARLAQAVRTKRVRGARPAERGLGLFP